MSQLKLHNKNEKPGHILEEESTNLVWLLAMVCSGHFSKTLFISASIAVLLPSLGISVRLGLLPPEEENGMFGISKMLSTIPISICS